MNEILVRPEKPQKIRLRDGKILSLKPFKKFWQKNKMISWEEIRKDLPH